MSEDVEEPALTVVIENENEGPMVQSILEEALAATFCPNEKQMLSMEINSLRKEQDVARARVAQLEGIIRSSNLSVNSVESK